MVQSRGVDMNCGPRWSQAAVMLAIGKGPYVSAMMPDAMQWIHEDVQFQVEAGFCEAHQWEVLIIPPLQQEKAMSTTEGRATIGK
eukprot:15345535-Ditylum_brightwellii.AAC.1